MRAFPPCDGVEHTFVEVDGVRLHVATAGPPDGPVVVLLHGWPQHWWLWHAVIPALAADGRRVLAPDLRGFGWSQVTPGGYDKEQFATDVLGLLDALGVAEADVVGHDWGGWTAQLVALRAPGRVRTLCLLNIPHVWQRPRVGLVRDLHRFAYQPLVATPGLGPAAQRGRLLWRVMARQGIPAASVDVYRASFREPGRAEAGSKVYRTFLTKEVPAAGKRYAGQRLRMPVRVLFGLDDAAIRRGLLDGFEDHADDVRIQDVPGCGHFIVDQRPQEVVAWLREVL